MQYAISDIHANVTELEKLIGHLNLQSDDALIFVGDYIDCLPHTTRALEMLSQLEAKYNCTFLKGNHEFLWEQLLTKGDLSRQEYLVNYGGLDALKEFGPKAQQALQENNIPVLTEVMQPYLELIDKTVDYVLTEKHVIVHAGLLSHQYNQYPLIFEERNYFIRPKDIAKEKLYLGTHVIVGGHHHLGVEPTFAPGYINIDLGGRQEKYLGAFAIEDEVVIRSDGKTFARN